MTAPDVPTGGYVKRFSVNLTEKGVEALLLARKLSRDNQTDVMNRALQWYAETLLTVANGGDVLVRRPGETEPRGVHLL